MSDLFLKNSVKNNINNDFYTTESSFNASKILGKSNIMPSINELSATSLDNSQVGGSATSSANLSKINSNDINNLLSMITSEASNATVTVDLENKLKTLLDQAGGNISENTEMLENKLRNYMLEDDMMNTEVLENKMMNIINKQQTGGTMGIVKSIATLAALGGIGAILSKRDVTVTESELNPEKIMNSARPVNISSAQVSNSSMDATRMNGSNSQFMSSETSVFAKNPAPGKLEAFVTTTDISPTSDYRVSELKKQLNIQEGGDNPALVAFRDISKMVSEKLGISNGAPCKKIAGQLQRDVKEENTDIELDKLVKTAEKYLDEHLSKYEKMVVKK